MNEPATVIETEQAEAPPKRSLRRLVEDLAEADADLAKATKTRAELLAALKESLPEKRTGVVVHSYGTGYRTIVYLVSRGPDGEPLIESAPTAADE